MLYYIRNQADGLIGFKYNNETYYYIKNNQNDIIAILDKLHNFVAKYTYDSWGNIVSITDGNGIDISNENTHIANINPFRYRSYYYDRETKLYYLNSRYYNPLWGRFINCDGTINQNKDMISNNLYVYCANDPINKSDSQGHGWLNDLWSGITKAASNAWNKVTSTANDIKNAFVLDVGVGVGADVEVNSYGWGYYNDKTFKIESGTVKTGNAVGLYAKSFDATVGMEYFHPSHMVEGNVRESTDHTQLLPLITTIKDCPETEVGHSMSLKPTDNTIAESNMNDTIFVGIDISAHIGIGGHIKIGFNIPLGLEKSGC